MFVHGQLVRLKVCPRLAFVVIEITRDSFDAYAAVRTSYLIRHRLDNGMKVEFPVSEHEIIAAESLDPLKPMTLPLPETIDLEDGRTATVQATIQTEPHAYGKGRCEVCGWTLAENEHEGCVPGNCSYRPEGHDELQRIRKRRAELAKSNGTKQVARIRDEIAKANAAPEVTPGILADLAEDIDRETMPRYAAFLDSQTQQLAEGVRQTDRCVHGAGTASCIQCDKDEALKAFEKPDAPAEKPTPIEPASDYFTPPEEFTGSLTVLPLEWIDNTTESETTPTATYQVDHGPNGWTAYYFSEPKDSTPDLESDHPYPTREAAKQWAENHAAGEMPLDETHPLPAQSVSVPTGCIEPPF